MRQANAKEEIHNNANRLVAILLINPVFIIN